MVILVPAVSEILFGIGGITDIPLALWSTPDLALWSYSAVHGPIINVHRMRVELSDDTLQCRADIRIALVKPCGQRRDNDRDGCISVVAFIIEVHIPMMLHDLYRPLKRCTDKLIWHVVSRRVYS